MDKQLDEYRKLQQQRYQQRPEILKKQEEEDLALASKLQQEEELQEQLKLAKDEEIARQLQQEEEQTDNSITTDHLHHNSIDEDNTTSSNSDQDDVLVYDNAQQQFVVHHPNNQHQSQPTQGLHSFPRYGEPYQSNSNQQSQPLQQQINPNQQQLQQQQQRQQQEQLANDEELARRLQQAEMQSDESDNSDTDENDYPFGIPPQLAYQTSNTSVSPIHQMMMHHQQQHQNLLDSMIEGPIHSPLRTVMPQFRTLTPFQHPLLSHLMEIQHSTVDPFHSFPGRRIVFPSSFSHVGNTSNVPPELQQMMRGEVPTDYESLLRLGELLQPVNRGATEQQLSVLPTRQFKKNETKETQCGICLSDYEEGEEIKTLPRCLHSFHSQCIDKWLGINKVCPVCREEIDKQ